MLLPFYMPTKASVSKKMDFNVECVSAAPTLVLAFMFLILYLVDQVQNLIEQMYLMIMIIANLAAAAVSMIAKHEAEIIYGIIHIVLVLVMMIDFIVIIKERGYALCRKMEHEICQEVCEPMKVKKRTLC